MVECIPFPKSITHMHTYKKKPIGQVEKPFDKNIYHFLYFGKNVFLYCGAVDIWEYNICTVHAKMHV